MTLRSTTFSLLLVSFFRHELSSSSRYSEEALKTRVRRIESPSSANRSENYDLRERLHEKRHDDIAIRADPSGRYKEPAHRPREMRQYDVTFAKEPRYAIRRCYDDEELDSRKKTRTLSQQGYRTDAERRCIFNRTKSSFSNRREFGSVHPSLPCNRQRSPSHERNDVPGSAQSYSRNGQRSSSTCGFRESRSSISRSSGDLNRKHERGIHDERKRKYGHNSLRSRFYSYESDASSSERGAREKRRHKDGSESNQCEHSRGFSRGTYDSKIGRYRSPSPESRKSPNAYRSGLDQSRLKLKVDLQSARSRSKFDKSKFKDRLQKKDKKKHSSRHHRSSGKQNAESSDKQNDSELSEGEICSDEIKEDLECESDYLLFDESREAYILENEFINTEATELEDVETDDESFSTPLQIKADANLSDEDIVHSCNEVRVSQSRDLSSEIAAQNHHLVLRKARSLSPNLLVRTSAHYKRYEEQNIDLFSDVQALHSHNTKTSSQKIPVESVILDTPSFQAITQQQNLIIKKWNSYPVLKASGLSNRGCDVTPVQERHRSRSSDAIFFGSQNKSMGKSSNLWEGDDAGNYVAKHFRISKEMQCSDDGSVESKSLSILTTPSKDVSDSNLQNLPEGNMRVDILPKSFVDQNIFHQTGSCREKLREINRSCSKPRCRSLPPQFSILNLSAPSKQAASRENVILNDAEAKKVPVPSNQVRLELVCITCARVIPAGSRTEPEPEFYKPVLRYFCRTLAEPKPCFSKSQRANRN